MTRDTSTLHVVDWRDLKPESLTPEYAAEAERWRTRLHWELEPSLRLAENARVAGRLPGLAVRDASGQVWGWGFFTIAGGTLQIGVLRARNASVARLLLDGILTTPETATTRKVAGFLFADGTALASALSRRRFSVARHRYLAKPLSVHDASAPLGLRSEAVRLSPWREDESASALRLLAAAYAGTREQACFAPNNRLHEWAAYVGHILKAPGCGIFQPDASFVLKHPDGGAVGLVLTTRVAPDTAHIAQIAVDPALRGRGLGTLLVQRAIAASFAAGARRITLLVSEGNPACQWYHRVGFSETATFLYAARQRPNRQRAAA